MSSNDFLFPVQFFIKAKLDVPNEFIEGSIHCKPGAAKALLERAYSLLTKREYVVTNVRICMHAGMTRGYS